MPEIASLLPSFLGATGIAAVHLFVRRMRFGDRPGSIGPDVLAGIALGYVFVDILPHLGAKQLRLAESFSSGALGFLDHHVYLMAMAGFLFYLAILMTGERETGGREAGGGDAPLGAMALGCLSMSAYTFLIGFMLSEQRTHGAGTGTLFGLAMGAHAVGLDHFYAHRYPQLYDAGLRFALVAAVYAGWALGAFGELSDPVYALLFAFLAGGVMIVSAGFELPRIRSWRPFVGFCAGAAGFTALVLLAAALAA